jgi:hypothetical protein
MLVAMADIPTASPLQVNTLMEANWLQWHPAACLCQRSLWHVTLGESLPPSKPTLFKPVAPATTLSTVGTLEVVVRDKTQCIA